MLADFAALLDRVAPSPADDAMVRLWYQAIAAYLEGQFKLGDASLHLRRARQIFPADAAILLASGCLHETFAAPRIQSGVQSMQSPRGMNVGVGPFQFEVSLAETFFRQSLRADPDLTKARVRLARVKGLRGDQAALVTFSHVVGPGLALTADLGRVRAALEQAQASGSTALIDGTYAGMMVGESDVGRSLLIVFSDGVDTSSWLSADAVLETARRSDVVVYGVSADSGGQKFLRDLSRATGGSLFEAGEADDLATIFVNVLEEFRQRYLVSYSPRGVSREGWHRIGVRVKGRGATVKARPGYVAGS